MKLKKSTIKKSTMNKVLYKVVMEGAIIFGMESKGFIPTESLDKSQRGYGQKQIKVGVE